MTQDYYKVLGVSPGVHADQIKEAYRRRAMERHPDRGGSHEQMVLLNEAYQILSNPVSRQHYDASTSSGADGATRAQSEQDTATARSRAENYPRTWNEFDSLFERVSRDFSKAEYGSIAGGGVRIPTAGKSVSGWAFIIAGAIAGFWIWRNIFEIEKTDSGYRFFGLLALAGGAWVGRFIHEILAPAKPLAGNTPAAIPSTRSIGEKSK